MGNRVLWDALFPVQNQLKNNLTKADKMIYPIWLYILRLADGCYYVGTTTRAKEVRIREHFDGHGCFWTQKHPPKSVIKTFPITKRGIASRLENEVWMHYARRFGAHRVRGGDVTIQTDTVPDWCLPIEFGGSRTVHWG